MSRILPAIINLPTRRARKGIYAQQFGGTGSMYALSVGTTYTTSSRAKSHSREYRIISQYVVLTYHGIVCKNCPSNMQVRLWFKFLIDVASAIARKV